MPLLNLARRLVAASLVVFAVTAVQPVLAQEADEAEGTATAPKIWTD